MLKQGAPVREFTDAAALLGHYAEVQRRIFNRAPAPQMPDDYGTRPLAELQRERARREAEEEAEVIAAQRGQFTAAVTEMFPQDVLARQPRGIITRIAHKHGFTYEDIVGGSRHAPLVIARREAIGAVKDANPLMTLPILGRHFRMDHTSILHALRRLRGMSPVEAKAVRQPKGRRL